MAGTTKLTDASVKALKVTGRDQFVYEAGSGFGVRLTKAGSRIFVLQVRFKGVPRRLTIGPSTEWSVKDARAAALSLAEQLRQGLDPAAERKRREVEGVTLASFWTGYVERQETRLRPMTLRSYRAVYDRYLAASFGPLPIRSITRAVAWEVHEKLRRGSIPTTNKVGRLTWAKAERSVDGDGGASRARTANKALQLLRLLLSDAEDQGVIPVNSHELRNMKLPIDRERSRFLSDDEVARVHEALAELEGHSVSHTSANFLRVMMLSGARGIELQSLRWEHVDEAKRIGTLPRGKNGDIRTLPLAGAWDIIDAIPRSSGLVFWARSPELPFAKFRDAWRLVRERAGCPDVTVHDIRHSFASVVLAQGHSLGVIGQLLGHRSIASTRRYSHLASSAANEIAEQAAAAIGAAAKGGRATSTVKAHRHG